MRSVGIDGCKDGWVAVNLLGNGFEVEIYKNIEQIYGKYADASCILVDMPIGLPETAHEKRPEAEARKLLKGRASCIFNTPCRQAVYAKDYQQANQLNQTILGKGLSKQSFFISEKIREIDELLQTFPACRGKLHESHPEICFAVLASSQAECVLPLNHSKYTEEGRKERIDTLKAVYDLTDEFVEHICTHNRLLRRKEDCIDALCLAITGRIGLKYGFVSIPENPEKDVRGVPMQMIYAIKEDAQRF